METKFYFMLRKTELVIFKSKRKKIVNEIKLILKFFPTNRIKIDENVTGNFIS